MTASPVDAEDDVGPSSAVSGLNEEELAELRVAGEQWRHSIGRQGARLGDLPVDPGLHRFRRAPEPAGAIRFMTVDFVATDDPAGVSATSEADALPSRAGRIGSRLRRVALGAPLASGAVTHERMRKLVALPILFRRAFVGRLRPRGDGAEDPRPAGVAGDGGVGASEGVDEVVLGGFPGRSRSTVRPILSYETGEL